MPRRKFWLSDSSTRECAVRKTRLLRQTNTINREVEVLVDAEASDGMRIP